MEGIDPERSREISNHALSDSLLPHRDVFRPRLVLPSSAKNLTVACRQTISPDDQQPKDSALQWHWPVVVGVLWQPREALSYKRFPLKIGGYEDRRKRLMEGTHARLERQARG